MFYRIFGKNGTGKTEYVFDKLSECVKDRRKAFLIVPEQSAVMTEKQIIKRLGGKSNLYVEVINFKRLCNRVFRQVGGLTSTHLDEGAKKLLMLMTLREISPFLREYGKSAESAEFASKAISFVNEMKHCSVSASKLENIAEKFSVDASTEAVSAKLFDLALISEAYNQKLSEIPGVCGDIYEKLCEKLRENSFFDGCDVFFDSFYGFTQKEYEIVSLIAEQADNTYITFACDKDCDDEMFERSKKAALACLKIAEKSGCCVQDVELCENHRHKENSDLDRFFRNFDSSALTSGESDKVSDGSMKIALCRNIYDEAKFAVSRVLELLRGGASFSDISVCAKNISDYIGVIDTFFEKAGIPLGIDIPETLSESALFELVNSALEASSTFSSRSVIRYIKTGITGLSELEADLLEIYIRTWDISPRLMKQDEDWEMNPDGYVDSEPDEYTLAIINRAKKKAMTCLLSLADNIKNSSTIRDFCMAVFNLLKDIERISDNDSFDDGNGGISKELLYECLDSFVSFAEDEKITLSEFANLFKSCGADYNTGHIPARSDEVRFSSVDLVRCENVRHVILLGVNTGVFPSACTDNGLVSDAEKQLLKKEGIELSEDSGELVFDELFLAYNAVTSARESCSISYLAEDLSSSAMYPSVIVNATEKITGCETVVYKPDNIAESYTGNELLFEEYSSMVEGEKKNTLKKYFSEIEDYKKRLEMLSESLSQPDYLEKSTTDLVYGNKIVTSYSRIEKMVGCPFSYFCTYTLKLKPEPKASLGPSEAGSVMHKILEELVPLLCRQKDDGTYPDEDEAKELVSKLLREHLSRIARTDISKVPKRFVYLYNRLSRILFEMAVNIVRELRVTKFVPCDFELNISNEAQVKPIPIDLGDGCTLYITGQVDRVDVYEKDGKSYIRIVDYKTGKKVFKMKDIKCGFNLQMLLYLASIASRGKEKYGDNIVPAGVLYSNVLSSALSFSLGEEDIEEKSKETSKPTSSGIFLSDEEILFAMDPTENSTYLPIGRKDGVATKSEALASLEEMGELLNFALATSKELAKEMRSGLKSVSPFDGRAEGIDVDPCKYCDMYPVCMRDIKKEETDG